MRTEIDRTGSTADARHDGRASRSIDRINVEVLVRLGVVAARAHVHVERNRRFEEASEVDEDFAFALAGEVVDQADARLQIVLEVVELQVGLVAAAVSLLVIPAQTEVELNILGQLVVVLNVEALTFV